jgi:ABC-type nitrate/sulfonate/bicarbonate transport system ATPase subunit
MFQQANLMPWRNGNRNITLPLELQGAHIGVARDPRAGIHRASRRYGFETVLPRNLSGGMAQRVALAPRVDHGAGHAAA